MGLICVLHWLLRWYCCPWCKNKDSNLQFKYVIQNSYWMLAGTLLHSASMCPLLSWCSDRSVIALFVVYYGWTRGPDIRWEELKSLKCLRMTPPVHTPPIYGMIPTARQEGVRGFFPRFIRKRLHQDSNHSSTAPPFVPIVYIRGVQTATRERHAALWRPLCHCEALDDLILKNVIYITACSWILEAGSRFRSYPKLKQINVQLWSVFSSTNWCESLFSVMKFVNEQTHKPVCKKLTVKIETDTRRL